ncbi:helix-turn-helix domain-containing protein [Thermosediminibacter litoriperuensis]|uniref:Cytoskeletal protein RodZ n=1 Tax=Thermosediminibacter litoriperuensis TaxID=291989 RepID=A0A5S5AS07_9FIRM|nr:RodZ domain-containing protein [Thermosediminibacter litoriperuensis]TYP54308.1 cytoskeletal protein RodZ [Thermosediminibacter litoriperuensis]
MDLEDVKDFKELGEYLKRMRLSKNISLEQIQKDTKIRIKYLSAIESGSFELIPGGEVYIKGFLKNYAEAVGLDSKAILERYKEIVVPTPTEDEFSGQILEDESPRQHLFEEKKPEFIFRPRLKNFSFILAAILILAVLIGVVSSFIISTQTPVEPASPTPTNSDTTVETEPVQAPPEENKENTSVIHLVEDDGRKIVYTVEADIINVRFEVERDRCWIRVKKDGILEFEGHLGSGESKVWEAKDSLTIRVGNPPVVRVNLNGKEVNLTAKNPTKAKDLVIMRKQ